MPLRAFISQATVDSWVAADLIDLQGEIVTLRPTGVSVRLWPASFFTGVSGGGMDEQALVGRVKDYEAIAAMGGEAYMSSVVVGDVAYDVDPGFLAEALPPETADMDDADLAGAADRALVEALRAMPTEPLLGNGA